MATATGRAERRLAAILAADVVGYARLIEHDEIGTLERLKALRKDVIEPILAHRGGRIVKLMGDGALCEFGSAFEAVMAAVEMQQAAADHEQARPAPERILFRMGISLGDVVHEDGDIFGEGVNLAARLEPLAEPGGICVTRNVLEQARNRAPVVFTSIGRQVLKNIADPVEVWRLHPQSGSAPGPAPVSRRPQWLAIGLALLMLIIAAAGGWHRWLRQPAPGSSHFAGKPSIAVLPFDNLSTDPEQGYLADGIAEDIITQLARNKDLKVLARTTSFSLRGQGKRAEDVAGALGVDYVLEGSVRRTGESLRLNAQLIDGESGQHIWAEHYDRPAKDVIQVQDAIIEGIAGELFSEIRQGSKAEALRRPVADIDSYTATVKALALKHTFEPGSYREARRLLLEVLAREPDYAQAHAVLGYLNAVDAGNVITGELGADDLDAAIAELKEAIRLDSTSTLAYQGLGVALGFKGDLAGAIEAAQRSIELGPSDADNYILLAGNQSYAGQFAAAEVNAAKAFELNPNPPIWYLDQKGAYLFGADRYEELVQLMRHCLRQLDGFPSCLVLLAAAEVALGRLDDAKLTVQELRRNNPLFTLEIAGLGWSYPGVPEKRVELLQSLAAAGLT